MSDETETSVEAYEPFARRILASGYITDPWLDGAPRFAAEPLLVPEAELARMYRAAENVAAVYDELCHIVSDEPDLEEEFFGLSPYQRLMWRASDPLWHGIARADVFVTDEGLAVAELNADTPTGEAEAVVLSELAAADHPALRDPNAKLAARFAAMIEAMVRELGTAAAKPAAGLVYATDFTEDLAVIRLYRAWLEGCGYRVVLGSPYNLAFDEAAGLRLFDEPIALMLRHYKTDWWGERESAWSDEDIPDRAPLEQELAAALRAHVERRATVVNPFGAVLPQNKRCMAFMWEHIHRFSTFAQGVIERHVPITSRLETLHREQLLAEREQWVLKSDYGAEGDEVVLGSLSDEHAWRETLDKARTGRWIAQRYFRAEVDARGRSINYGVFLVAGLPCGLYARSQQGATDVTAASVPTLVVP